MQNATINYRPPRSLLPAFKDVTSPVISVMGPRGSGKSSFFSVRAGYVMQQQKPGRGGIRRSKGCVVRETYSKIETTVMETWKHWNDPTLLRSPVRYGMPHIHHLRFNDVDCEVMFLALDRPDDVGKLQSLEFSWIWFNEAANQPERIHFDTSFASLRFPPMSEGGPSAPQVMLDYNACDQDHWLYRLFEEQKVEGYRFIRQPPALVKDEMGPLISLEGTRYSINPEADNLDNLPPNYYRDATNGKSDAWIKVYLLNEYGFFESGRPVYGNYNDRIHFANHDLRAYPGLPLLIGLDFGSTPCIVLAQFSPKGQLRVLDEILPDFERGMDLRTLIETRLKPWLAMHYANIPVHGWGDPNGIKRNDNDGRHCFHILAGCGFKNVRPAPFPRRNITARVDAVDKYLTGLAGGEPRFLLSKRCRMLRAGFMGKYQYGKGANQNEPVGNGYDHIQDALQYLCLGLQKEHGEDQNLTARYANVDRYNQGLQTYVN